MPKKLQKVMGGGIAAVVFAMTLMGSTMAPAGAATARTARSWFGGGADCMHLVGTSASIAPSVSITPNFDGQVVEIFREYQGSDGYHIWTLGYSDLLARVYYGYGLYGAAGQSTNLYLKSLIGYKMYSEEDYVRFNVNGSWSNWQRMGVDSWC
jgi:hypothetical protein